MSNMTEHEALALAIESMEHRRATYEFAVQLYERQGKEIESVDEHHKTRTAIILYARLTEAINLLKAKL